MHQQDDRTIEQRRRQPTLQQLAARRRTSKGGGRLDRFRSWHTVLVGVLSLAMLATFFLITR